MTLHTSRYGVLDPTWGAKFQWIVELDLAPNNTSELQKNTRVFWTLQPRPCGQPIPAKWACSVFTSSEPAGRWSRRYPGDEKNCSLAFGV